MSDDPRHRSVSRRILALAVALSAFGMLAAPAETLDDARDRYAAGEYESAIRLFEKAAESMTPSAAIYFELGRAQEAAGHEAQAALSFERALLLDPAFSAARTALAESWQALGINAPPSNWLTRLEGSVSPDVLTGGGMAAFWAAGALLLGSLFRRGSRGLFFGSLALFLAACLLLSGAWFLDPRITKRDEAMILQENGVELLKSPVENSERVGRVPQGGTIRILSQRGRWFYGRVPGGATGWFPNDNVAPLIPSS